MYLVNSSSLVVVGGWDGENALTSVEILNLETGRWETGPSLPEPSYGHACLRTEVGGIEGIMVTGGALTG